MSTPCAGPTRSAAPGSRPGDNVPAMGRTSIAAEEHWLGLGWLRAVHTGVNTDFRGRALAYILANCRATHMICEKEFLDRVARAGGRPRPAAAGDRARRRGGRAPLGLPRPARHGGRALGGRPAGNGLRRARAPRTCLHQLHLRHDRSVQGCARALGAAVAQRDVDRHDRRRRLLLPVPGVPPVGPPPPRLVRVPRRPGRAPRLLPHPGLLGRRPRLRLHRDRADPGDDELAARSASPARRPRQSPALRRRRAGGAPHRGVQAAFRHPHAHPVRGHRDRAPRSTRDPMCRPTRRRARSG